MKILKGTLLLGLFAILSCGPQGQQAEMIQEAATKETPPPDYDPEARLSELGIELATPSSPVANYVNAVRTGNLVFSRG